MKTLVLGGSLNPDRYSNKAINLLKNKGIDTVSFGLRAGEVAGIRIDDELKEYEGIHTVTLYLNPTRQKAYYDYILSLRPERIIFNPGTENKELEELAERQGVETVRACTLVMLSTGQY